MGLKYLNMATMSLFVKYYLDISLCMVI